MAMESTVMSYSAVDRAGSIKQPDKHTHTHTHTHTHCTEYIPFPMSPGGCPLTCGAAAVGGDMYSCLLPAPNTPAQREETAPHKSVSVQGVL